MKNVNGSALLLILIECGILSLLVLQAWFIVGFEHDCAWQRVEWVKNFYAADMVLNVGINLVCSKFDYYKKQTKEKPALLDVLPVIKSDTRFSVLTKAFLIIKAGPLLRDQQTLLVVARCWGNNLCVGSLECLLSQKDKRFVVSHFTIGTSI